MKNSQTVFSIILATATLLLFQNCSQVAFQASASSNGTLTDKDVIRSLEPALAVRATGCMSCHANVTSNIISDFGHGDSYYFAQNMGGDWWKSGSPYGDHGGSLATMNIASDKKFIVPRVQLPPAVATATGLASLKDYVASKLGASNHASTKMVEVKESDTVVIAAPSDQDLELSFNLGNARSKYKKASGGADLSGILDKGTFFQNSGTVTCDGDLVVRGPLHIQDLNLQTTVGCRIYVIGSVFLYGAVNYLGTSDKRNLQITSSRSINLGLGLARDAAGNFCDPNGHLAKNPNSFHASTLTSRYVNMWTVPASSVRGGQDPKVFGQDVVNELAAIEASLGTQRDAECRPEGRLVSFERILLNAPAIHSRYTGQVKGTIIAEFALMSLSKFNFEFDPVFRSVDVLPALSNSNFLQVTY